MIDIKEKLIKAGVANLKEFGYPQVNEKNILTDEIYKEFFKSMLNENKGHKKDIDEVIDQLLYQIK